MLIKLLNKLVAATLIAATVFTVTACNRATDDAAEDVDNTAAGGVDDSADLHEIVTSAPADVIAMVGDQSITFNMLNTMLNSSAMVGLSIPALGTPERQQVIITLLDKAISANLIYLDARDQGTDKKDPYLTDMAKFEDAVLASMYQSEVLIGEIPVSEQEVEEFYATNISKETELTDDVKLAIESKIRKQRLEERKATVHDSLRDGVEITIVDGITDSANDSERKDTDVIATAGGREILWGEVKGMMVGADQRSAMAPFQVDSDEERMTRLQRYIDQVLMTTKARAAGMDKSPDFINRTREYRKTRLITAHREKLIKDWQPSDDELQAYYLEHMEEISAPESRKIQMVVVETREEAEDIKARIDSDELTMFQAAQQYSIDPSAKRTLGDMGWVTQGTGFQGLDEFTFGLEPEVVGGPVESPAGWHLIKVLDVLDARYENIDDAETRRLTQRAYVKEKFDNYVVGLRKNRYDVEVYNDVLASKFQEEADMIAELTKKAAEEGSVTEERIKELEKWIPVPPSGSE